MPYYFGLRDEKVFPPVKRDRVIKAIARLRVQLAREIPRRDVNEHLLLATWNLREFENDKGGPRLDETYYYLAEVISSFDLVAVQEVLADLAGLKRLMEILGRKWSYIVTDITEGPGTKERLAFVYDTGKVSFEKLAGEVVLPETDTQAGKRQLARTPFLVAFQAGWFKFMLCTAHIYYGEEKGDKYKRRVEEIKSIAGFLKKRAHAKGAGDIKNYILLGDFNIVAPEDETMAALKGAGFTVPPELMLSTDVARKHNYDQIAFILREGKLQLGAAAPNAGAFDFYKSVFREEDESVYKEVMNSAMAYKTWRTYQMSDHMPLWVQLKVDFTDDYLERLMDPAEAVGDNK